jgi:hypothetical protein
LFRIKDTVNNIKQLKKEFAKITIDILKGNNKQGFDIYVSLKNSYKSGQVIKQEIILTKDVREFKRDLDLLTKPVCNIIIPVFIQNTVTLVYIVVFNKFDKNSYLQNKLKNYFLTKYEFKLDYDIKTLESSLSQWIEYSFYYKNSFSDVENMKNLIGTKILFNQMEKLNYSSCVDLADFSCCCEELNIVSDTIIKKESSKGLVILVSAIFICGFLSCYLLGVSCTPPKMSLYYRAELSNILFDYKKTIDLKEIRKQTEYFLIKDRISNSIVVCRFNSEFLFNIGHNNFKSY